MLKLYTDGLAQDCSNSIANTLELPKFCTKSSIHLNSHVRSVEFYHNTPLSGSDLIKGLKSHPIHHRLGWDTQGVNRDSTM